MNPPRNRKGGAGNPPPKGARASALPDNFRGGGWKRGLWRNCEPTSQPKGRGWKPSAYGCARQCSTQRRVVGPLERSVQGGGSRRLEREYQKVWGADLCGQVSQGDFLVSEPVNPVPDRGCHRRLTPRILVLPYHGPPLVAFVVRTVVLPAPAPLGTQIGVVQLSRSWGRGPSR